MERLKRLVRTMAAERGQDMVEYALIVVFIAAPIVLVGIALPPAFTAWAEQLAATIPGGGP